MPNGPDNQPPFVLASYCLSANLKCTAHVTTTTTPSRLQVCKKKQTCFTVNPKMNADISGHDIACQGNSFCKVCGGLDAVKNGCADDRR